MTKITLLIINLFIVLNLNAYTEDIDILNSGKMIISQPIVPNQNISETVSTSLVSNGKEEIVVDIDKISQKSANQSSFNDDIDMDDINSHPVSANLEETLSRGKIEKEVLRFTQQLRNFMGLAPLEGDQNTAQGRALNAMKDQKFRL